MNESQTEKITLITSLHCDSCGLTINTFFRTLNTEYGFSEKQTHV